MRLTASVPKAIEPEPRAQCRDRFGQGVQNLELNGRELRGARNRAETRRSFDALHTNEKCALAPEASCL